MIGSDSEAATTVPSAVRAAGLGLALGFLAACGGEPAGGPSTAASSASEASARRGEALIERLIAEDPQVLLAREELFDEEPVFTWKFASSADVAPWQTRGLAAARLERREWRLQAAGDDPQLVRRLELDAAELHLLEVTLSGLVKGKATLFWAGPGESFTEERSLTVEPPAARRRGRVTLTFDLAGQGSWRGDAERLRLDPTDAAADEVRLRSIRGLRRVAKPEQLTAALGRGWKIDLEADVRNALLAVPGVPVERRIEVGRGQRLRLAYGLEATVQQAVEFRVTAAASGRDGEDVLLEETLDPAAGAAGAWHQATLDLDAYAGRALRISLETRSAQLLDLARGFAVWGNPEVVGPGREAEPPNVILISIDTLRSDRLSAYGHRRQTSPNLDRWAADSAVLFENAVVQAPWTLPSHASMFTGLEAMRHDVNHYQAAPPTLEMLAETLRRAGYSTAAITGGGYLRPKFGFAQGFDRFRYWPQILAERELADGAQRLFDWLDENHQRPFFLLFHTYEVHFPHRRRQPYFDRFLNGAGDAGVAPTGGGGGLQCGRAGGAIRGELAMRARPQEPGNPLWQHDYFAAKLPSGEEVEPLNAAEKALLRTCYDSAIAYVDAQLGRLFERLEALGLTGQTLIVVTSDHGEALGEKDRAGHNYLEDYNVMVPLVIALPGGRGAGRRIDRQVRSIDVVPTILDALGIPPAQPVDGVSLLPLIDGQASAVPAEAWTYASSANYGLGLRFRNQLKYVFNNTAWSRFLGTEALYNLRRDPGEEDDQAPHHRSISELRARARQAIAAQHQGLRMRVHNRGEGVLSGRLKHAWARHNRVKAADPSCRCLRWDADRKAVFSLAPGQEMTLYFESVAGHRIGLEGRLEVPGKPPAEFDQEYGLRRIGQAVRLEYSQGRWRTVRPEVDRQPTPEESDRQLPPTGEAAVAFTIWRESGDSSLPIERPQDARLREQLQALGYVD